LIHAAALYSLIKSTSHLPPSTQHSGGRALSLQSTGATLPMLVGNLTAILVSAAITTAHGLVWPDDYDWWVSFCGLGG